MLLDAKDMNTFIEPLLASDSEYVVWVDFFFFLETNSFPKAGVCKLLHFPGIFKTIWTQKRV